MTKTKIAKDTDVGAMIRAARVEAGMTQTQLAKKLRCSFQSIAKYERGQLGVRVLMLIKIARALGCAPASLLPPR